MKVPLLDLQAQYETIRDEVRASIERVCESQQFVLGAEVQALEEEIAQYSQTKFAIGCASGSDALLLALMSCGVGLGHEVSRRPSAFSPPPERLRDSARGRFSWILTSAPTTLTHHR